MLPEKGVTMSYQQYFQAEHDQIRQITRRFVEREMRPFVDEWEEAGSFPRELYQKAARVGILGMGYPEELGGTPGDLFMQVAVWEELMRPGSGGLSAGLGSLHIALPPILALGTLEQQERFIRPVLAGERIAALAVTEPGGGSRARRAERALQLTRPRTIFGSTGGRDEAQS